MIKTPRISHSIRLSIAVLVICGAALFAQANEPKMAELTADEKARELRDVGIYERLGGSLDLSMKFKDETGQVVTLGSFYDGTHPVVISPVYFSCPGLCNFHLNGAIDTLKNIDWTVGKQFQYIALSFDTKETPELAQKKKAAYMKMYGKPGSESGWHFLTGDAENVQKLTEQIGFKYKWNEETKEWAHASVAVVTTPKGTISRYQHGILFDEKTFKMALNEASEGKVGTFVDRMIWFCFHYDPHQSKYTLYAANVMKAGGVGIILILMAIFLPMWIRSRKGQA